MNVAYLDINWKTYFCIEQRTDGWMGVKVHHFCILKVIFLRERHLSQSQPLCLKLELDVFYVLRVIIPNDCHCIALSNPQTSPYLILKGGRPGGLDSWQSLLYRSTEVHRSKGLHITLVLHLYCWRKLSPLRYILVVKNFLHSLVFIPDARIY